LKNIINTKNFEISGFTIIGIAIALMIVGGSLPIPLADSMPTSSSSKSSNLRGGDILSSVGKSTAKSSHPVQATSSDFIPSSDSNTNNSGKNESRDYKL